MNTFTINAYSSAGCYIYSGDELFYFIEKYDFIFIGVGFFVGIFICFMGFKLWKPTIFIMTFLPVSSIAFVVLFVILVPA